jgi:hypothetical protein
VETRKQELRLRGQHSRREQGGEEQAPKRTQVSHDALLRPLQALPAIYSGQALPWFLGDAGVLYGRTSM